MEKYMIKASYKAEGAYLFFSLLLPYSPHPPYAAIKRARRNKTRGLLFRVRRERTT